MEVEQETVSPAIASIYKLHELDAHEAGCPEEMRLEREKRN